MVLPSTQEPLLPPGRLGASSPDVLVRDVVVEMTEKQEQVLNAGPEIGHIFFEGGMGSGKTMGGAHWLVSRSATNPVGVEGLVVSPSYPNMQQSVLPRIDDAFKALGLDYALNWAKKQIVWTAHDGVRRIWLRSAEKPMQIAGSSVGYFWMDEPAQCSFEAYKRSRTRVRDARAVLLQRLYTGTHEGTKTWFHRFRKKAERSAKALVVTASTFDNPFNSADYYEDILDTYAGDPAGMAQYIWGRAADAAGNIYTKLTDANVVRCEDPGEGDLVVGWDFNVGWMVTVLGTWHAAAMRLHVWGEVTSRVAGGVFTEDHAAKVRDALMEHAGARLEREGRDGVRLMGRNNRQVSAWIDASGYRRQTTGTAAVKSDAGAVEAAGFHIRSDRSNPFVRNRIAAVQRALKHRSLLVDPRAEVTLTALREHSRDKFGDPQKDGWAKDEMQLDHYADALGYLTHGLMPLYHGSRASRQVTRQVSGLLQARVR